MSKSKHNVVNPDDIVNRYGSDCFRLYSMFLGPIEEHKPWNNQGIDGVYRFMNKFWRLIEASKGKCSMLPRLSQVSDSPHLN